MLPYKLGGPGDPCVVMLHWLGGSYRTWTEVSEGCASQGLSCAALDLPGFGDASDRSNVSIASTVDAIIETIQSIRIGSEGPWFLAGHSMGGKFASIVARAALDRTPGLNNLRGLILISPSPPGPEPMKESVREKNIESLGHSNPDADKDRVHAENFVDDNTGKLPLLESVRSRTVDDLVRMNRVAFVNWFEAGSREDWTSRVGTIPVAALILAGTEESALGPDAQREHTLPSFSNAVVTALQGSGHLSPLERPAELADRIVAFVRHLGVPLQNPSATLDPEFRKLIDSDLTSPQTRAVLNQRLADDHLAEPDLLSSDELLTLRAIARRLIPGCPFDLAARIHRWLALPAHDGWRHDSLPPDTEAWRIGLHSFDAASVREHRVPFSALDAERQDELLVQARDGDLGKGLINTLHLGDRLPLYTASQMSDWFGDLHAELTRLYVADPRTMHRIGFTGFADEAGLTQIRLNEREVFEL